MFHLEVFSVRIFFLVSHNSLESLPKEQKKSFVEGDFMVIEDNFDPPAPSQEPPIDNENEHTQPQSVEPASDTTVIDGDFLVVDCPAPAAAPIEPGTTDVNDDFVIPTSIPAAVAATTSTISYDKLKSVKFEAPQAHVEDDFMVVHDSFSENGTQKRPLGFESVYVCENQRRYPFIGLSINFLDLLRLRLEASRGQH